MNAVERGLNEGGKVIEAQRFIHARTRVTVLVRFLIRVYPRSSAANHHHGVDHFSINTLNHFRHGRRHEARRSEGHTYDAR